MSWLPIMLGFTCLVARNVASAGNCEATLSDGSCLRALYKFEAGMDFAIASTKCSNRGGRVAIIENEDDYDAAVNYLRSKIARSWRITSSTWIGVKVNTKTGEITKPSSGEEVFIKWNPEEGLAVGDGIPRDWTNVYVQVKKDEDDQAQGMSNFSPTGKLDGVLCQFSA